MTVTSKKVTKTLHITDNVVFAFDTTASPAALLRYPFGRGVPVYLWISVFLMQAQPPFLIFQNEFSRLNRTKAGFIHQKQGPISTTVYYV